MRDLLSLLSVLNRKEKKRALVLLCLFILMGLLEVAGIASILPFIAVLADPEIITENSFATTLYNSVGFHSETQLLFFLGVVTFLILGLSTLVKVLTTYYQLSFVLYLESSLGSRLIALYLNQDYLWLTAQHSADLGKNILSEVGSVIANSVMPATILIAQSSIILAIITFILIVDPILACVVLIGLGSIYAGIYLYFKNYLKHIGDQRLKINEERYRVATEAFNAAKEIKFFHLEGSYIQKFATSASNYARLQVAAQTTSQIPRFIIELFAFGGLIIAVLALIYKNYDLSAILPIITLYAISGYRLLPALQQLYNSVSLLKYSSSATEKIVWQLTKLKYNESQTVEQNKISFENDLRVSNVNFRYPNSKFEALKSITFSLSKGQRIGIVGHTGSGKTTLVDVLLGLLQPSSGQIFVDGKVLSIQNLKSFQETVGYVPQNVYLSDNSVTKNITMSDEVSVNPLRLEEVAKIAHVHDLVLDRFEGSYEHIIGERGSQLSGGECQRIGIARALYRSPSILILDEATSALDNQTEKAVIDAISNFDPSLTIIMIAHRLSSLRHCDKIIVLEKGELKEIGSYEELYDNSPIFHKLVQSAAIEQNNGLVETDIFDKEN